MGDEYYAQSARYAWRLRALGDEEEDNRSSNAKNRYSADAYTDHSIPYPSIDPRVRSTSRSAGTKSYSTQKVIDTSSFYESRTQLNSDTRFLDYEEPPYQDTTRTRFQNLKNVPSPSSSPDVYQKYHDYQSLKKAVSYAPAYQKVNEENYARDPGPSYHTLPHLSTQARTFTEQCKLQQNTNNELSNLFHEADKTVKITQKAPGDIKNYPCTRFQGVPEHSSSSAAVSFGQAVRSSHANVPPSSNIVTRKPGREFLKTIKERLSVGTSPRPEVRPGTRDMTESRWCSVFILSLIVIVILFVTIAASVLYHNCEFLSIQTCVESLGVE